MSAITDAVEVTIANKQPKDRESPVKSRKQREQTPKEQQQPIYKEISKEPPAVVEKQVSLSKDEVKHKDIPVNVPQTPASVTSNKDSKETVNLNQKEEGRGKQRKEKGEQKITPNVTVAHDVPENINTPASTPQSPAASQESPAQGK